MVKKSDFNTKVTEIESKIPCITGLATNSELTVFEDKKTAVSSFVKKKTDFNTQVTEIEVKILDVSSLVKKSDYATEITNIKNDYVTNPALNTGHKDLIQKTKFDTEVKKINDEIASNSCGVLMYNNRLSQAKGRIYDLERYGSSFRDENYFDGFDGAQNTLVFQTMKKHFNLLNEDQTGKWKSKWLCNQYLNASAAIGYVVLSKPIKPMHVILKGKGTLVKNDNDIIGGGPIINIYTVYITSSKTIKNCLFGEIKIADTTNSDTDK